MIVGHHGSLLPLENGSFYQSVLKLVLVVLLVLLVLGQLASFRMVLVVGPEQEVLQRQFLRVWAVQVRVRYLKEPSPTLNRRFWIPVMFLSS